MPDFPRKLINVRYYSNSWGAFRFDFKDSIPMGTTINSFVVRSFKGKYDKGYILDPDDESTSGLIDTPNCIVSGGTAIYVYFDFPNNASFSSQGGTRHSLVFELTLSNGASHPFYFHYVVVYE